METLSADVDYEFSLESQINVPPSREGALWKVITTALRCPKCESTSIKAVTGKRLSTGGMTEQYRQCSVCKLRFRVVLE